MFAASARHTNAGIMARTAALPPITRRDPRDVDIIAGLRKKLEEAEKALADLTLSIEEEAKARLEKRIHDMLLQGSIVNAQMIIAQVSRFHDVPVVLIKGPRRSRKIISARFHAIYEVRRRCDWMSLPEIGRLFGGRDHTTVLHATSEWPKKAAALGIPCAPINLPVVKGYTPEAAHG